MNISDVQIGLDLATAMTVVAAILSWFLGRLSDRKNEEKMRKKELLGTISKYIEPIQEDTYSLAMAMKKEDHSSNDFLPRIQNNVRELDITFVSICGPKLYKSLKKDIVNINKSYKIQNPSFVFYSCIILIKDVLIQVQEEDIVNEYIEDLFLVSNEKLEEAQIDMEQYFKDKNL